MNFIKELLIISHNKRKDVVFQSLAWMIISMVAAYPNFCLNYDLSIFCTTTRDEYCNSFLLPIMLFLLAFILDFFFSIKDLNIGHKRGVLFKFLTILLCLLILEFCLITIFSCVGIKVVLFILLWLNISLIKGLTVLIPGADDLIMLTTPINNLNKH